MTGAVGYQLFLPVFALSAIAFVVWFVGLSLFGLGPWFLLHRYGFRGWRTAVVLGFTMTFVVTLGLSSHGFRIGASSAAPGSRAATGRSYETIGSSYESISDSVGPTEINYRLTAHGWHLALEGALEQGGDGVLVALAVWLTAYRRWSWSGPAERQA